MISKLTNYRQNWKNELIFVPIEEIFLIPDEYPFVVQLKEVPTFQLPDTYLNTCIATCLDYSVNGNNEFENKILTLINPGKTEESYEYSSPFSQDSYWINFQTGEIEFNPSVKGKIVKIKYYGIGNLVYQENINNVSHLFDDSYYNNHDIFFNTEKIEVEEFFETSVKYNSDTELYEKYISIIDIIPYYDINIYDENNIEVDILKINSKDKITYDLIFDENSSGNMINNTYKIKYTKMINGYHTKELKFVFKKFNQHLNDNYKIKFDKIDNCYHVFSENFGKYIGKQNIYYNVENQIYKYISNEFDFIITNLYEQNDEDTIIYRPISKGHTHDGIDSPRIALSKIQSFEDGNPLSVQTLSDIQDGYLENIFKTVNGYFQRPQEEIIYFSQISNNQNTFYFYMNDFNENIPQSQLL